MQYIARTRFVLAVLTVLVLVALPAAADRLELTPCEIPGAEGAKCGSLSVPENPDDVSGRQLDLRVVVLEATGERRDDPIFYLSGGPGTAASSIAPVFSGSSMRATRDFVLMDQRGTGGSNPLRCDLGSFGDALRILLSFDLGDIAATCAAELSEIADLHFYSTRFVVDDFDAVRSALGYSRINLLGGSYGTRVALEYLRSHGEHARTAILRGVAGPDTLVPLGFSKSSLEALRVLAADCASDSACRKGVPDLEAAIRRLRAELDAEPMKVEVRHPATGEASELEVSGSEFAGLMHYPLYGTQFARQVPAMVMAAEAGDLSPALQIASALGAQLIPRFYFGSFLAVMCSEDAPFFDEADIAEASRDTLLGGGFSRGILASCAAWPASPVSEDFKRPVESSVPVLLVSGAADPVTPASDAEAASRTLPNSLHLVLPATGHFGMFPGCSARLVAEFLDKASVEGLDGSCVADIERPTFPG